MNPEFENIETPELTPAEIAEAEEAASLEMDMSAQPGTLSKLPPAKPQVSDQQWQDAREKLYWLLTILPERLGETFGEYKKPITTIGIILTVIPFVALAVAILDVINAIPLFAPTFELVGFGFSTWFIYRYLLFADKRQEFSQELQELKGRVLGPQE